MGLLIDTDVFIGVERSRQSGSLDVFLRQIPLDYESEEVFISVITVSELVMGVHRANNDHRRERRRAFVEAVLARFGTAVIDVRVARFHAELTARLMADGQTIGTHDSWIAATGLALGHVLVTGNVAEFKRIRGLSVVEVLGTNQDHPLTS